MSSAGTLVESRRGPQARSGQLKPTFRPEVQGLRALAVLMVVAYHVWLGRASGGVDIFLLVFAFLLTLSFVRDIWRESSRSQTREST